MNPRVLSSLRVHDEWVTKYRLPWSMERIFYSSDLGQYVLIYGDSGSVEPAVVYEPIYGTIIRVVVGFRILTESNHVVECFGVRGFDEHVHYEHRNRGVGYRGHKWVTRCECYVILSSIN